MGKGLEVLPLSPVSPTFCPSSNYGYFNVCKETELQTACEVSLKETMIVAKQPRCISNLARKSQHFPCGQHDQEQPKAGNNRIFFALCVFYLKHIKMKIQTPR